MLAEAFVNIGRYPSLAEIEIQLLELDAFGCGLTKQRERTAAGIVVGVLLEVIFDSFGFGDGCRLLPFIGRSRPHAAASDLSRQQSDSVAPRYDERIFLREAGSGFYPAGYTPRTGRFAPGCGFRTLERSFAPLSGRAAGTADARSRIPEIYDALCPYDARRCTALSGCNLFAGNLSLQRYAQGPAGHVLLYAIHDGSLLRNAD